MAFRRPPSDVIDVDKLDSSSSSETDTPSDLDAYDDYLENPIPPDFYQGYADRKAERPHMNEPQQTTPPHLVHGLNPNMRMTDGLGGMSGRSPVGVPLKNPGMQQIPPSGHMMRQQLHGVNPKMRMSNGLGGMMPGRGPGGVPVRNLGMQQIRPSGPKVRQQETKKTTGNNINTKLELENGESKPLKHWILEACVETLQNKIDEVNSTKRPGIPWCATFGVEAVWKKHGNTLQQYGYTQKNVRKSIDRVIQKNQVKPLTGIGELDETDPIMRPAREEGCEDDDDSTTQELVENILSMRAALEIDRKGAKEAQSSQKPSSKYYIRGLNSDKDDDSTERQVPVGLDMKEKERENRKRSGDARSKASLALDIEEESSKRVKATSNSSGTKIAVAIDSISQLAAERMKNDQERIRMEREDRDEKRRQREEERKEKEREREEQRQEKEMREREKGREKKNLEETLKKELNATMEAGFAELRQEAKEREDGMKKFLTDLLKK